MGPLSRIWLFRAVLVLSGPAVLVGLEAVLRLWPGTGPDPLIVTLAESRGKVLRSINALFARRFFFERHGGHLIASGRMAARPFVDPSEGPIYRVVFVGASTVQGYPHPRRLAAAAFLEAMLQDAWPDRQVQVFNLGITSLASFAVARVLQEAMELQPDLAVVYTGHNEFYGIYGVGGRETTSYNRVHYGLMQLRLGWQINAFFDLLRGRDTSPKALLEIRAESGQVPLQSAQRTAALNHLQHNLSYMAEICRCEGVELMFCTVVANDAGFAPVAAESVPPGGEEWERWVEQAADRITADDVSPPEATAALALLERVAGQNPDNAWVWYLRGRTLVQLGRGEEAFAAFRRARDLDLMPWRAPRRHNAVIRQVATAEGVALAAVDTAFILASPSRGVGWELMADHVHPSVAGQVLLARTVLQTIREQIETEAVEMARLRTHAQYRALLGDLPVERVGVDQAMAELLRAKPMDAYNAHNARRLERRAADGWRQLSPEERQGARKWTGHRDRSPLVLDVADVLFKAGDFARAREHYAASRREAPCTPLGDLWATVQWAWCTTLLGQSFTAAEERQLRRVLECSEFLAQAPDVEPSFIDFVAGELHHFLAQREPALRHLERAFLDEQCRRQFLYTLFPALAVELAQGGRLADARRYAKIAVSESGNNRYFFDLVETLAGGGAVGIAP